MTQAFDHGCFRDPPHEFRPEPFWGLNDLLDPEELRRQVSAMRDGGWGGFFVHPRHGLETGYLQPEYMECMRTIAAAARTEGLRMWLYDEHPFPAGAAGGLVGAERRDFRHRVLAANLHTRPTPLAEGVALFAIDTDPRTGALTGYRRLANDAQQSADTRHFLHFYEWEMPVARAWNGYHANAFLHGFPFTDLLNPAAVARFIELTYVAHQQALGDHFGTDLVGAFSDIPVYNWHYSTPHPSVPWTDQLPARFEERFGYDLTTKLPCLLYPFEGHEAVRSDFWKLVSDLFVDAYTRQLAAWCHSNGISYSAHYWGEETLHWQVAWTGDVMHHFALQDIVGNDHILRNIDDPIGVKQAASVAEQLQKPRMLTEIYALSGHNLTYEERKWIGEWAFALGSNMLVPYIPSYSLRGGRKRDEPPSQFVQQPYWREERILSDYFARLGYALTRGERVVDTLVLQPLATARCLYAPGAEPPPAWHPTEDPYGGAGWAAFQYSDAFGELVDWMLQTHHDFHIGNEQIMQDHARVEGDRLQIGTADYAVVVIPPSLSWSSATLELLQSFAEAGGKILALEPTPTMIDGRPGENVLPAAAQKLQFEVAALREELRCHPQPVTIGEAPSVLCQHRYDAQTSTHLVFLVNTDITGSVDALEVALQAATRSTLEQWDPLTGSSFAIPCRDADGALRGTIDLAPAGSCLLIARPDPGTALPAAAEAETEERIPLTDTWKLNRADPNVLVLDFCEAQIEDSPWTERIPVWRAHELVMRAGIGRRFRLRFAIDVSEKPDAAWLAVEDLRRYTAIINGSDLTHTVTEVWWDPRLLRCDVTQHLRTGINQVELSGLTGIDTRLEPIYLLGEFAVERTSAGRYHLARPRDEVGGEDLTAEGYPFFIGRATLTQTVSLPEQLGSVVLELDQMDAIAVRVRANHKDAGFIGWKPYRVDLSPCVHPGENALEIELITSLHNILGPQHDRRGEVRHFVIDSAWMDTTNWTDEYYSTPLGIRGAKLVTTEAAAGVRGED